MCVCTKTLICAIHFINFTSFSFWYAQISRTPPRPGSPISRQSCTQPIRSSLTPEACLEASLPIPNPRAAPPLTTPCGCGCRKWSRNTVPACRAERTLSCPSPIRNKSASLSQRMVQDYLILLHIRLSHIFCRSAKLWWWWWWWWWCSIIFHTCACVCAGYSRVPSSVYDFTILMRVAAEGDTHTVKQTS